MDMKEIKELIKLIDSSSITEFKLAREDYKISIKKEQTVIMAAERKQESHVEKNTDDKRLEASATAVDAKIGEENVHFIKSPIVGTFYSSPSPGAAPYAKPGDKIKKGDVLCIVEAMKLMNEVTADIDGEITEVLVKDKSLVEYNQPLFKVRQV